MRAIIIKLLFIMLLLIGCSSNAEKDESGNEVMHEQCLSQPLFSEENWKEMKNLFEKIKDDLMVFVSYLEEYDLFNALEGVRISYHDDEDSAMYAVERASSRLDVIIYNDDLISAEMLRSWGPAEIVKDDFELTSIIMRIGELGVISTVTLKKRDGQVWVSFGINQDHPLAENIYVLNRNFFHYIDGDVLDLLWWEREIEERWYMEIEPPPHW